MMTIHLKINGKEVDKIKVFNIGKGVGKASDLNLYRIEADGEQDVIVHRRSEGARVLAERVLRNVGREAPCSSVKKG